MPRTENGGLLGSVNYSSQNYAAGVWTSKAQYLANLRNLWPRSGNIFLAVTHSTTPFMTVYPFSSLGYGTKYSDPATLPPNTGNRISFSPDGKSIAVASSTTSPYYAAYPFSPLSGIGTRYSDPVTVPTGQGNDVTFNPTSNTIAVAHSTSPFVSVYPFTTGTGGGFGTKYSDPATAFPGNAWAVRFHPNGNYIAAGSSASPYVVVYNWSSGWGTRLASHASNYTSSINIMYGIKWHPSGNFLISAWNSTGTLNTVNIDYTYEFIPGTGFGTAAYTTLGKTNGLNAAGGGGSDANDADVSPNGNDVAFALQSPSTGPFFRVFPFSISTGFGNAYADPATYTSAAHNGVGFHPDGTFLAFAHTTSPFISTFNFTTGVGVGTRLSTTGVTLPTGTGNGIGWVKV